jgi:hypothetical protein
LPSEAIECINVDILLKSEIKATINQACSYTGSANESLLKQAFPGLFVTTLKTTIAEMAREIESSNKANDANEAFEHNLLYPSSIE